MDCRQAQALSSAAIDGELDLATELDLDEHLAACRACRERRESAMALHALVSGADLAYAAPPGLDRRIARAIRSKSGVRAHAGLLDVLDVVRAHRLGFLSSAAAVVLALALGIGLGRRSVVPVVGEEIVDNHIRSLMPGHLTDQASSEHHTVKPWFAGRLDFSPPVPDLSAEGFTLAGARLDYAEGRPIAALVYRRRQHVINLFLWPSSARPVDGREGRDRGYNIVHAAVGRNEAWAVSDLNVAELRDFMRLVQQHQ